MQKEKLFNSLFTAFLLLAVSYIMVSCQRHGIEGNPVSQQPPTDDKGSGENLTDRLSGKIDLPTSDATTFLANCKVISISDEVSLDGTCFDIEVPRDELAHTFVMADENENVYLLARTLKEAGSEFTLDAESSALALATLHPLFGPLYGSDFIEIINKIKRSARYSVFYKEVEGAVKQHRNLFDGSNESLIAALDALYDDVLADIDFDIFNNSAPVASSRAQTRSSYSTPSIPSAFIYADITDNVLTLQCTGLTPSYYGTVKIASTGETKSYAVTSRSDYGGMDIFKPYDQFNLGEKCPFTFTEQSEYYFSLSRTNSEATFDYYIRLANTILGIVQLNFGDETVIREIATTIANALKDAGLTAMGPDQASFRDWFGVAYGSVLDYLQRNTSIIAKKGLFKELRVFAKILGGAWNVYGKIKGVANASARIAYAAAAPEDINFYLCYFKGVVDTCSGAQLSIVSGNNQKGKPETKLEEPLKVLVRFLGNSYSSSNFSLKFEVVSGGGYLDTESMSIDSDVTAENFWTLGKSGSQRVKAVVIDAITNKEISGAVYFSATFDNPDDYRETGSICPDDNHPHMVNLGLPSGTKWRCCNMGANSPEEYGAYGTFYDVYSLSPSIDQIRELLDSCSYSWTTLNDVNGGKFTGPNGRTIFLPACGSGNGVYKAGLHGMYLSSSSFQDRTWGLGFNSKGAFLKYELGFYQYLSVRPVYKD